MVRVTLSDSEGGMIQVMPPSLLLRVTQDEDRYTAAFTISCIRRAPSTTARSSGPNENRT